MPFEPRFADVYKFGIKGAAEDAGAYAERLDEQIFVGGMLDRIFNQISKADVIVADMTGRNANVFYEVGYAHALGKIVLLLTQAANDIPFDLKHHPHIVYGDSIERLRSELTPRLEWAIRNTTQAHSISLQGIEVSVQGTILPQGITECDSAQVVELLPFGSTTAVNVAVRNVTSSPVKDLSHVYLFASSSESFAPVVFVKQDVWTESEGHRDMEEVPREIAASVAAGDDAFDGLNLQYRLPVAIASIPPRAVDEFAINLRRTSYDTGASFRLRFHGPESHADFSFRIEVMLAGSGGPGFVTLKYSGPSS